MLRLKLRRLTQSTSFVPKQDDWDNNALVRRVIGKIARGSVSYQEGRYLTTQEREERKKRVLSHCYGQ